MKILDKHVQKMQCSSYTSEDGELNIDTEVAISILINALEEQAKLFMSCLPETKGEGPSVEAYHAEFLSNAEKLGLINKKDV